MISFKQCFTALALLFWVCAPTMAGSSAASSLSTSIGTAVGSISGSIQKSSDSSSTATGVAAGDYRIIGIVAVAERPGMLRMKLQKLSDHDTEGEFFLYLPQEVVEQTGLAEGGVVTVRERPYGVEFAQGQPLRAFFLVLSDDWYRELQTTAVVL